MGVDVRGGCSSTAAIVFPWPGADDDGKQQRGAEGLGEKVFGEHRLVACYIGAAYWFTASTSFANPAAAFGRMFSDSFAGISPASVGGFVVAELAGAAIAVSVHHAFVG
jgi:glycerol uptake facilitator-like aquaporin